MSLDPRNPDLWDVVVLGAGAAGLMCAFEAGRRGRRVLVVDAGERPGRKILISGGGRCNFTNLGARAENFLGENPDFARSALAGFTPADMITLAERHRVPWHEKTLGQLFCDDSAKRIVDLLLAECAAANVTVRCGVAVTGVRRNGEHWVVEAGSELRCRSVVVATGGLSIPKLGATGVGYAIAREQGLRVVEPRPALVPLVFHEADRELWCDLAGVAGEVVGTAVPAAPDTQKKGRRRAIPEFRERVLITHRGLSGPVGLQVSSYWRPGGAVRLDWAPGREVLARLRSRPSGRTRAALENEVRQVLPARLATRWVESELAGGEDWTNAGLDRLERALHGWQVSPAGTEGFAKAEVTAGGVATDELDARTMQARRAPGLFFIGEVVDITGWLGGYNFQWAWASAVAAGKAC